MSKNKYKNKGNNPQNKPEEPTLDLSQKVVSYEEALENSARAELGESAQSQEPAFEMADLQSSEKEESREGQIVSALAPAPDKQEEAKAAKEAEGEVVEEGKTEEPAQEAQVEVEPQPQAEQEDGETQSQPDAQEEDKQGPAEEQAPAEEEVAEDKTEEIAKTEDGENEEASEAEDEEKEEAQDQAEGADGEGEEKSEEDEEAKRIKAEAKAAKKAKRMAWVKKHIVFISVTSTVLAVLIAAVIAFLVITKDMAFVGNAAAIDKAIGNHKTELVLTGDVTYSGDLTMDKTSINLYGHTLTIAGTLHLTAGEEGAYVGKKLTPWSAATNNGALVCEKLVLMGPEWQICGNVTGDLEYPVAGNLTLNATLVGDVLLDEATLALYGAANTITGGTVTVYDGAKAAMAKNSNELVIYPLAEVSAFDTANYYYIYRLDAPTVWVNDEGDIYTCTIAGTGFVKEYRITFAGEDKGTIAAQNGQAIYKLPADVKPGNYSLVVVAQNSDKANHCIYLDSTSAKTKVKYYADLSAPAVQIVRDGTAYKLAIGHVDNATQFAYSVNGGKIRKVTAASDGITYVDITTDLSEVGTYLVTVVAKHPKANYNDSKKVSATQVVTKQLTMATNITAGFNSANSVLTVNATSDGNTSCVAIEVISGGSVAYSVQCRFAADGKYEVVLPTGIVPQSIRVTAIGTRYYTDSETKTCGVGE